MGTWIVGAVVFGIVVLCVFKVFSNIKRGDGCSGCGGCGGCRGCSREGHYEPPKP